MLGTIKRVREQRAFSRKNPPTEQRIETAFLMPSRTASRSGWRAAKPLSPGDLRVVYFARELFEPEPGEDETVVVDEPRVPSTTVRCVQAAIDCHSYEMTHVETSSG